MLIKKPKFNLNNFFAIIWRKQNLFLMLFEQEGWIDAWLKMEVGNLGWILVLVFWLSYNRNCTFFYIYWKNIINFVFNYIDINRFKLKETLIALKCIYKVKKYSYLYRIRTFPFIRYEIS